MADGVGPQHGRGEGGRRRWLLPAALGAAVVVVAGVVVGVVLSQRGSTTVAATEPTAVVTTVHLPAEEIGETAVELLLERVGGRELPKRVTLATSVRWRGSTLAPVA